MLRTHSAGGLTAYDFTLAAALGDVACACSPKWLADPTNARAAAAECDALARRDAAAAAAAVALPPEPPPPAAEAAT